MEGIVKLNVDGCCLGNPGTNCGGGVVRSNDRAWETTARLLSLPSMGKAVLITG